MGMRLAYLPASVLVALGCRGVLSIHEKVLVDDAGPTDAAVDAACPNGLTACAAGCTPLDRDPSNCGQCGRSCLGGTCTGGTCAPRAIVPVGNVTALAEYDDYVLWASDDRISRVPKVGGEVIVVAPSQASAIVYVKGFVYYASPGAGTISRVNPPNGPPSTVVNGAPFLSSIAYDAYYLYFTTNADDGGVGRAPLERADGGSWTNLTAIPHADGIARDNDGLWVTGAPVGIWHTNADGTGTAPVIASKVARTLATDLDAVYYADHDDRQLVRWEKDGGAASPLADTSVLALTADKGAVYWVDRSGVVASVAKRGGPTTVLAHDQAPLQPFIVVDDTSVYWVSGDTLYATPK